MTNSEDIVRGAVPRRHVPFSVMTAMAIIACVWFTSAARAMQEPNDGFEVASIRVNVINQPPMLDRRSLPHGRLHVVNMSLRDLIVFTYGDFVHRWTVVDGPGWITAKHFDIEARFPAGLVPQGTRDGLPEKLKTMMRKLLAERFRLDARIESREMSQYVLVRVPKGSSATSGLRPHVGECLKRAPRVGDQPTAPSPGSSCGSFSVTDRQLSGFGVLVGTLVRQLERLPEVGERVEDKTALTGLYDVTLDLGSSSEPLSAFTGVREQLGLKLEHGKIRRDVIVIHSVSELTPN